MQSDIYKEIHICTIARCDVLGFGIFRVSFIPLPFTTVDKNINIFHIKRAVEYNYNFDCL